MTQNATGDEKTVWLTQEAFDKLKAEHDYLVGPARAELANKIGLARDEGDLRENGGYHAAKEEQGKSEARIRQLEDMLRRAQVGETAKKTHAGDAVEPGMRVTIAFDGDDDDTETFLLGSREMLAVNSDHDLQVYSPQSPLGAAILGSKPGDTASYEAPNGKKVSVTVKAAEPFEG